MLGCRTWYLNIFLLEISKAKGIGTGKTSYQFLIRNNSCIGSNAY